MEGNYNHLSKSRERKYQWTIAIMALVIVGMGSFWMGANSGSSGAAVGNVPVVAPGDPTPAPVAEIKLKDDDHVLGDPNADVLVVEYSDIECPFCARLYSETLPSIKQNYVDTGKVAFVFRHFPLSFHPNAQKAAEASECAAEQGKFWEMHDIMFDNQGTLSVSNYKLWAGQLGLNQAQFDECLDSGKYAANVQEEFREGQQVGVQGTPATFVNGVLVSGAQPYAAFQSVIDSQL